MRPEVDFAGTEVMERAEAGSVEWKMGLEMRWKVNSWLP